jgi:hypothetical protein
MQLIHFTQAAADPQESSEALRNRTPLHARPHVGALHLLGMQIFRTHGATDPLKDFGSSAASFLPRAALGPPTSAPIRSNTACHSRECWRRIALRTSFSPYSPFYDHRCSSIRAA